MWLGCGFTKRPGMSAAPLKNAKSMPKVYGRMLFVLCFIMMVYLIIFIYLGTDCIIYFIVCLFIFVSKDVFDLLLVL